MWNEFLSTVRGDIRRLDSVIRYNSIPVIQRESVASHSFWVSIYSLLLHRTLNQFREEPKIEATILRYSLTHDLGECLTGDVVRTFKYSSKEFRDAVNQAEELMISKYFPVSIRDILWDLDDTKESKYIKSIVKAADFVSLYMFMNREWARGNRELLPFIERMVSDLKSMASESLMTGEDYDTHLSSLYSVMSLEAYLEPGKRPV